MNLRCTSFEDFSKMMKEQDRKIVMFGAGVLGQITVPQILRQYGVLSSVYCFVDNDKSKWGSSIELCGSSFPVYSPAVLKECGQNTVILLNISRYSDVLKQLQQMEYTQYMDCYLTPMMCIYNFCSEASGGEMQLLKEPVIPPVLHYMWLGKKPIPDNLRRCMDSWRRFCPDYEIIEWNEDNYDVHQHPYMKQAYDAGAYGFVPDYARLDILYHHGGFYLDTDVELKREIDELRFQEAFCGVEKWQVLNFGGLSGAVKGHPMIGRFLEARENITYMDKNGRQNKATCGFYDTRVALDAGYVIDGTTQTIHGMNICAYDYFHPYDYMSGTLNCTQHTYSVHWFNGGWLDDTMKQANVESARRYARLFHECMDSLPM